MERTVIAFDLDDTLYKERDYVRSGHAAVARDAAALSGCSFETLYKVITEAPDAYTALQDYLNGSGYSDAYTLERFLEIYRNHLPDISLDPAVLQMLNAVRAHGAIPALITDGRSIGQRNKIRALGLDRLIEPEYIIVSEETGADKKSPVPFRLLRRRTDNDCRTRYYYVGDNPAKDFHYPNLEGWRTVMLRDTAGVNIHRQDLHAVPPEYRPGTVVESLSSIPEICHIMK